MLTRLIIVLTQAANEISFIASPGFQGISPIYYQEDDSFYFFSGQLDYKAYSQGLQCVSYDQIPHS